jgi:enamine deaminase RidA (YjgF/YER057c/UK114 family)
MATMSVGDWRPAGMKLEEIAQIFRVGNYSAISGVIGRPQAELAVTETMARLLEHIQTLLRSTKQIS